MTYLVVAYLFDIGGELSSIEVQRIAATIGEVEKEGISEIYTDYFVELGMAPVRTLVDEGSADLGGLPVKFRRHIKLMTFGVVLVEFSFSFNQHINFETLREAMACKTLNIDGVEKRLMDIAENDFDQAMLEARGKFKQLYDPPEIMDSYRFVVDDNLRTDDEICSLLMGKDLGTLSKSIIKGMMKGSVSQTKKNKLVISNTSSYIYSDDYPEDFINIIALSRVQLFELKVYDIILDKRIARFYTMLETLPFRQDSMRMRLFSGSYKKLSNVAFDLMELRIELVDMVKDVMNSMKVTDDMSLAYLYRAANHEFRIDEWYEGVRAKLDELEYVYRIIIDRHEMLRTYDVEFLILLVIILEIFIFMALGIL